MGSPGDAPSRSSSGFEGEVVGLGLADIIQVNARNRFSGSIRVQDGQSRGVIFFRDGEIVHAEQGTLTGEDAFCDILGWRGGRFTLEPNVVTALRTIQKSCEHLLLEAHRLMDERARGGAAPAAAPAPARRAATEGTVDIARRVPGVADAVLLTRAGERVQGEGYAADVLAGQTLFIGLVAAELGAAFQAGELRAASLEGTRQHLLVFATKSHVLGVFAKPDTEIGAVDAAVRAALAKPR